MKILLIILYLINVFLYANSQNVNFYLEYTGSGSATNIVGNEKNTYTKTGGGTWTKATITRFPIAVSSTIKHNSQTVTNHEIIADPISTNYKNTTADGIKYASFDIEGPLTSLTLTRKYKASTSVSFPSVCRTDPYPLPAKSVPDNIKVYLDATTNIQSDNVMIATKALSIVQNANCKSVQCVVEEIAKWVAGNVKWQTYNTHNNPSSGDIAQDALSVFNVRILKDEKGKPVTGRFGNCTGFTNITIAMLRSLEIPARFVSGYLLPKEYNMPYITGYFKVGGGDPGPHACHEIYYPSIKDWVRGDGQVEVHFGNTNFVKMDHGTEQSAVGIKISYYYPPTGEKPVISNRLQINSTIGSVSANYTFFDVTKFDGTLDSVYLFAANNACISTGIYDKVFVSEPPANTYSQNSYPEYMKPNTFEFAPGNTINFHANFTTGSQPPTWATIYRWKLFLYHSTGKYEYASGQCLPEYIYPNGDNSFSYWKTATNSSLPVYEWVRDPIGNIYGEVEVTVDISDGDIKTDNIAISLKYKPNRPVLKVIDSDENTITLSYSAEGANSYKIYYGLSKFPPYTGTQALEGTSPINVGQNKVFSLSDIPRHTTIAVIGINQNGESDYSNTVTFSQYARLPYSTGFENYFDNYWTSEPDNINGCRYLIYGSYSPRTGNICLAMGACNNGTYASNFADLHLNIHNEENVILEFWWKDFGDEYHAEVDGIWFSDNGGSTFTKVYDLNGPLYPNNIWSKHVLNISSLASQHNLLLTKNFVIRFAQKDDTTIPTDGFAFDDISVYSNFTPPSPVTSITLTPDRDATLMMCTKPGLDWANTNYGTYPMIKADEWTISGYRTNSKNLFDFGLSVLPENTVVKSARLSLYANNPQPNDDYKQMSNLSTGNSGYKSNACWLKRVTEYWDENTVTYNNRPQTTDYNAKYLPISKSYTQNYLNIDVTKMVEDMIKYPNTGNGMMLELNNEIKYTRMAFASTNHTNTALHPKLSIEYYIDEQVYTVPFTVSGSTVSESNDWDVQGSDGRDKAFIVYIPSTTTINATTCSGITNYDTKLEIFKANKSTTGFYNDDYSCNFNPYASSLNGVILTSGYYYFVVDGYNGNVGNFQLSVTAVSNLKSTELFEPSKEPISNPDSEIVIYPNPVKDELTIKLPEKECFIKVTDMTGRILKQFVTIENFYVLNCSDLLEGVYLIQVVLSNSSKSVLFEKIE